MATSSETFFNRIRAAQTEPVRRDIRADSTILRRTNPSGFTPLEHAIDLVANKRGSSVEMINLLLDQGADPNFRAHDNGPTALHHAVGANELPVDTQHRIVTMLLKHGADTTLKDYSEQTPTQMPGLRDEIQQLLGNAVALRQSFVARGGVAVVHDRPATPPQVVLPWANAGGDSAGDAESPLQRVVGGAAQAVGAVGAAVQPLVAAAQQTGAGIMAGLAAPQVAAVPVQAVPDAELPRLFKKKKGALAMGNDVLVTECTLNEAYRKCLGLDAAVGFTFAPTAALAGGRYRCYFKSASQSNSDPLWQTYIQVQAPAAAVQPAGPAAPSVHVAAPAVPLPSVPAAQPAAGVDGIAGGAQAGLQTESENSDYNLRRLERRIKNLEATLTMLNGLGEDTTAIQDDLAVQQHALEARQMELQTQDLRRTRTGQSVAAPVVVVDEQAEFERLRREEMQRLDDRIKENTATLELLRHEAGHQTDKFEKELEMDKMQRDKYQRLMDEAAAEAAAALAAEAEPEPEPEPEPPQSPPAPRVLDTGSVIPCSELTVKRQVGVGAFKDVHQGEWQGGAVAILKLRNPDERQRREFMAEAAIFVQAGTHPNLLRYFGRCEPDPETGEGFHALVTELARHCSLDDFLEDVHTRPDRWNGQMPVTLKREAAAQIAAGMAHMHAQGLIHRDLAARNVLVTEYDAPSGVIAVQLTDYGLSRSVASNSRYLTTYNACADTEEVPKLWIPPESLQKRYYSRASDVWAFGITLWEIATNGRLPYDVWACGDEELVRRVVLGEIMPRPDGCPAQLYDVMRRCWIHKASERPKFAALEGELRAIEL